MYNFGWILLLYYIHYFIYWYIILHLFQFYIVIMNASTCVYSK